MPFSSHFRVRYVTVGLLLLALLTVANPIGHGATLTTSNVQHDSLTLTVSPDRSVGIASNMTTYSSSLQNASKLFPPGYAIQSSSSFSQQTNAVVETTNVQYLLPQALNHNLSQIISSVGFTGSQTGQSGQGSLSVTTTTLSPVQNIKAAYSTSSSRVSANASADVFFSSLYAGTPFENQTAFQTLWNATFANAIWIDNMISQIQNSTRVLKVQAFYGNVTYSSPSPPTSASVSITFIGIPSASQPDFVSAAENILGLSILPAPILTQLTSLIESGLNLSTGETATLTYTGSSGVVNFKSTTNYVANLDSQLNSLKNQFFQLVFSADPLLESVPVYAFLNSTTITVSKISTTSTVDLNAGTYTRTLNGLVIGPPTVGTSTNFTIPGLFQTLGMIPVQSPGVNITLVGGSDSSSQVTIVVPSGTPAPNGKTSNSATWNNVMNASVLQNVRFVTQPLPFSFLGFLTSPTGFAIDAIIIAAVVAGVILLARKQRTNPPTPVSPSGPTSAPGLGPSPSPPVQ